MSWCDLDLVIDPAVVTLTFKFCPDSIGETVSCKKLILDMDTG